MINPRRRLAVALGKYLDGTSLVLRSGVVQAVTAPTVTVTIDGVNVAGIRVYDHVTALAVGQVVELLVVGSDVRVIGRLA